MRDSIMRRYSLMTFFYVQKGPHQMENSESVTDELDAHADSPLNPAKALRRNTTQVSNVRKYLR